jgi:hypothetical protein
VIGVCVRLEDADEVDLVALRRLQIGLDRVRRVDDHCDPRLLVADQVRSAPEIVVDELSEEHDGDGSNVCGYIS